MLIFVVVKHLEKNLSLIQDDSDGKLHGLRKETTQILETNQRDNEKKVHTCTCYYKIYTYFNSNSNF